MIGALVRSHPVGAKPAFIGRVVGLHAWPCLRVAYEVVDLRDGSRWHRRRDELRVRRKAVPR